MSLRARAVIVDDQGRLLLDRTHHAKPVFYWLPGGGVEPGETAAEALERELIEEARCGSRSGGCSTSARTCSSRAATTATS